MGSVLTSRAASEPSASGETSAEDSVDDLEESAEGSIRGPSNHGGFQVDTTINQQALASGGANSHVDGVDTEQVSPSDTWVDEPEQVAFSNSVGQSEIPAISPVEEATRSNMEVQVCLEPCQKEHGWHFPMHKQQKQVSPFPTWSHLPQPLAQLWKKCQKGGF